jgi:predicted phosphodiesterase
MSYTIKILGTVGGEASPFEETAIAALLNSRQADLAHGSAFTGRPGTSLYLGDACVLKVRNELRLDSRSAERWGQQALDKERAYQIHHSDKTWFLAFAPQLETPLIGNICPRLSALHTLLLAPSPQSSDIARFLGYLETLFDHYCRIASQFNVRLDEGLSNFAVDQAGRLYYLDDDFYPWDRFVSCSHVFGMYFRSMPWLGLQAASQLGLRLREVIQKYFEDYQYATVLAEQLRDVFLSTEAQREAAAGFSDSLRQVQASSAKTSFVPGNSRYLALLADVHGNLPALEVILDFLRKEGIYGGLVLGDVVGYGPYPAECIERLQQENFLVLKGNHDHGLATGHFRSGFSVTAAWVLEWSTSRVSQAQKKWLLDLPPVLREEAWMALHGAPLDPTFFNAYVYEMTYENNLDYMQERLLPLCFHGHTHLPGIYARRPGHLDRHILEPMLDLGRFSHVLLCPGSVGQPRNRKSGAQFAIYDQEQRVAHFHTLPYDLTPMLAEMRKQDFPETLIKILENH